jgi:hypothetical protein
MTVKKKQAKTVYVKRRAHEMSIQAPERTRLVLSCTEEEKRYIRVLAAIENKTVSDYLLDGPRKKIPSVKCDFPECNGVHEPNEETAKVLRETDAGIGLESHESLEDFWKAMGMKPNAKD